MGIILLHCCVSPLVKLTRRLVFNESSQIFWFFCSNDTAKKDTNTCIFLFLLANLCDFFFFFNNEELWGFKILLKTSYFGVLFVWLVGFCSSGARHLQSLCPTSASSEISHPSWHYLGFCHISHLLLSTQQLIPLHPFVSSVLPRWHNAGTLSACLITPVQSRDAHPRLLSPVSHCHRSAPAEDRGSHYSSHCSKIRGKRSQSIWL